MEFAYADQGEQQNGPITQLAARDNAQSLDSARKSSLWTTLDPMIAPPVLRILGGGLAILSGQLGIGLGPPKCARANHHVPLETSDCTNDVPQPRRALDDGIEDRLHVRRRAANNAKHLGRCRLMLQRLAQFAHCAA